jgi:predicted RNA-binding protein YlxR (DUF448 family)
MMRIVRTPESQAVIDPTGKRAGRGAYIHRSRECWNSVLGTRGRLEHALNMDTPLSAENRAALEEAAAACPPRAVAQEAEARTVPAVK